MVMPMKLRLHGGNRPVMDLVEEVAVAVEVVKAIEEVGLEEEAKEV